MFKFLIIFLLIVFWVVLVEVSFEVNFFYFFLSKIVIINWEIINKIFMEFSIK